MLTILSLTILSGCDNGSNFAPVADIGGMDPIPRSGVHRVRHGESLYEIAWRYGMDYRVLAERNHMNSPYYIHTGELIYLRGTSPSGLLHSVQLAQSAKETDSIRASAPPVLNKSLTFSAAQKPDVEPNYPITAWIWPAKGKIINTFSSYNKGINIAGSRGEAIHAAAAGKVVYCGDGLRGYGNLIIIKHNSLYLSAYAHNRKVYVREGDWVRQGQKIAEMGNTGSDKVMLHFEIRRAGKPIDPASLL
jgi:lipoprotein NlpD